VLDLGPDLDQGRDAFLDTAAVMMGLDLVVSTDTSIAHLAGALGRPTWLALPAAAEWRWLLERSDSPWYPTMRLFRQRRRRNWQSVVTALVAAVTPLAANRASS
jgi:ADP-heptose:LPS heptosyltransferase